MRQGFSKRLKDEWSYQAWTGWYQFEIKRCQKNKARTAEVRLLTFLTKVFLFSELKIPIYNHQ